MTKTSIDRVRTYFESIADALAGDRDGSSVFPNRVDAGETREDVLATFFRQHLPARCEVLSGGFVFDSKNRESGQIDILITSNQGIQFRRFEKAFAAVESVIAVVSVKTSLTKQHLIDGLENLSTVPALSTENFQLPPSLRVPKDYTDELPLRILYGFDSSTPTTVADHVSEFYSRRPEIPPAHRAKLVVVNKKLVLERMGAEAGRLSGGETIEPYQYAASWGRTHQGTYGLLRLLAQVQKAANACSLALTSFDPYYLALVGSEEQD